MFSLKYNYIIVNYHYVRDPSPEWSGIYPCSLDEFKRQVKFLAENFKIVSIPELYEAAQKGLSDKFCALTFDDGLRDHHDNVLPVLKKYKAAGTFFIITSTIESRLSAAHRIHVLLSKISTPELINLFESYLKEFYPDLKRQYHIPKGRRLGERRKHEDIATANFKETMVLIPEDIKSRFLRYCFKKFHLNASKISGELFMSPKEINRLRELGMEIGSHTHNHYAADSISPEVFKQELKLSKEVFKRLLVEPPTIFSYVHGRHTVFARDILSREGFTYAVTIEPRGVKAADDPMLLPRLDPIHIREHLSKNIISR